MNYKPMAAHYVPLSNNESIVVFSLFKQDDRKYHNPTQSSLDRLSSLSDHPDYTATVHLRKAGNTSVHIWRKNLAPCFPEE